MNTSANNKTVWQHPVVLFLWALGTIVITLVLAFEMLPLPQGVAPLTTMTFQQGAAQDQQTEVALPDNWRSHPERPAEAGVYRSEFRYRTGDGRWGVYVPNYSGQITVRVNGTELSTGGLLSGDLIPDQSIPYFALFSGGTLKPGINQLEIDMIPGGKLVGFLSNVYIGPSSLLRNSFEWHYLRAVRLPELIVFWQLLLALLLVILWISRKHEPAALYCAILLLFSSLHGIPIYLPSSVDISHAIALLGYVVNFWLTVIGLLFNISLANRKLPFPAWYLFVLPALATIGFLVLPSPVFDYLDRFIVVPFSLVIVCWTIFVLVRAAIWQRSWECALLLIAALCACGLVVHDTLIIANVTPDSNFLHFRIVYILILPSLSVIFFQRLIHSMNHVDDLVSTLEERIADKENQLRETFSQRQILEGKQALHDERRRIMRDVHDGLGGQLMSIIAMSRMGESNPDQIETSAQAALEELRMLIGSLDVENDISGMLGTFRERAEQQLALHDIELDWQMIDIPAIEGLNPSRALNILRILQEATTNAVKHSGASKVKVRFSLQAEPRQMLKINIEDDGRGFQQAANNGHGLKNIRSRASELDGSLDIVSTSDGTVVSFTMPISLH